MPPPPPATLCGVPIQSDMALRAPLPPSPHAPQLSFHEEAGCRPLAGWAELFRYPDEEWPLTSVRRVLRRGESDLLEYHPEGDQIVVTPQALHYHHADVREAARMEARLLGTGFAWWLLRQGRVPLHAGVVLLDDGSATLLVADSGTGKSSLLCALLRQGVALLSDDFAALSADGAGRVVVASAYPQLRLMPATIEQFLGSPDPFPTVFPNGSKRRVTLAAPWGRFLEGAFPVTRIWLLQRRNEPGGPVERERLRGPDAFIALLTATIMAPAFPRSQLSPIWSLLEQSIVQAPVERLRFPSGWEHLPTLLHSILSP